MKFLSSRLDLTEMYNVRDIAIWHVRASFELNCFSKVQGGEWTRHSGQISENAIGSSGGECLHPIRHLEPSSVGAIGLYKR